MQPPRNIPNNLFFNEVKLRLQEGKTVKIRVKGSSMLPFVRNNDEVLLTLPHKIKWCKGTMVLADTDELGIVLHRIIKIKGDCITLMGDGNIQQIEHTSPERIIAIVEQCYRGKFIYDPNKWLMRFLGWLWYIIHPWRRSVLLAGWKLKQRLF